MTMIQVLPHESLCPAGVEFEATEGESLCDALLRNSIEIEHACEKSCACTTCHVIVREGEQNLSPLEQDEEDRLDTAEGLTLHSRLGCQAIVRGDVVVEIPK